MCGRFSLGELDWLDQRFGIQVPLPFHEWPAPRFNVAPSQLVPVVVDTEEGRALRWMQWGFQPAWLKDPRQAPPINARAETVAEKPMFREAVARRRCIIPADGFYEWQKLPRGKQPVYIRLKSGEVFGFAGLYTERRVEGSDDPQASCVIITTGPNELMATIHHRMPVILAREDEALWLDRTVTDPAAVLACLRSYPAEPMEAYPVSPLVSRVQEDGPALIERRDNAHAS